MLMFLTCAHCQHDIEERGILDIALFLPWTCPKCGKVNQPIGAGLTVEENQEAVEESEEITIESGDLTAADYENNILEGLK